jgi:hypothetical protein
MTAATVLQISVFGSLYKLMANQNLLVAHMCIVHDTKSKVPKQTHKARMDSRLLALFIARDNC